MGAVVVTIGSTGTDDSGGQRFGDLIAVFGTLTLSTSYAAGGDSFTNSQFGLEKLAFLSIGTGLDPNATTEGIVYGVNYPTTSGSTAAGTIQGFWSNSSATYLAEVSGNQSAWVAKFMALGW